MKGFFQVLRNNEKIFTFMSKVEANFADNKWHSAMTLLKLRPGEFARKLDLLLRLSDESDFVVDEFGKLVSELSTRILLQLMGHFGSRSERQDCKTSSY